MELIENLKYVWVIPLGGEGFAWAPLTWIVNSILWLLDLYPLVKKKSRQETVAVMMLPGFIFFCIAILSSLMLGITTGAPLGDGQLFMKERVCIELLVLDLFFLAMWFLAMWLRRGRNDTWKKRILWALSYVPDLIVAGCILTVSLARLLGGAYLLEKLGGLSVKLGFTLYNIFAWLYVYGITTILIRLALLLVAIFARLISMRIPVGNYHENSYPLRRFLWYAAVCQNAYLRGVLAFFVPMNLFFVALFLVERPSSSEEITTIVGFIFFLLAETIVAIRVTLKPTRANLRRFSKWGERKAFLEKFCREYFNEPPLIKTSDFTVTRNFLVDERSTVCVYYLQKLKDWRCCKRVSLLEYEQENKIYWSQPHTVDRAQRSGWQWEISFRDGAICIIEKEDADVDAIIKRINSYWHTYQSDKR